MFNDISPEGYSSPMTNFLPTMPVAQLRDSEKEREETLAQVPLLKTVIKRLDKRIAETDSVEETLKLADKYKLSREEALVLQNILYQLLDTERRFIETRISRVKP